MAIGVVEAIYRFKYLIFLSIKKHRENTGNLVLIRAWQPCQSHYLVSTLSERRAARYRIRVIT